MKKPELMNNFTRGFHRLGLQLRKHSPEILIGVGIVGTVVSTVLACKATLKVEEVTSEAKKKIEKIHTATETGVTEIGETYSKEDSKKDLTIVYTRTALDLAKLYAPSVVLGAASVGCMLASHNIVSKRNMALAAAYTAVDKGFKEYRGRVVERFGDQLDKELRYNIKSKEIEVKEVDENGEEKTVKKTVDVMESDYKPEYSDFARIYDCGCTGWTKSPEQNLFFLRQQQQWANELLKSRGYVFLNEVYESLGFAKTQIGQAYGWIYDEKNPKGDNYIDFGIYDVWKEGCANFVNGYERNIVLDFNVDGNILDILS